MQKSVVFLYTKSEMKNKVRETKKNIPLTIASKEENISNKPNQGGKILVP